MSKFKVGDEVIIIKKSYGKYYESNAIIRSIHPPVTIYDYEVETYDCKPLLVYEEDICTMAQFYYGTHLPDLPCECGAKHQRGFETFHSTYCPLYRERK